MYSKRIVVGWVGNHNRKEKEYHTVFANVKKNIKSNIIIKEVKSQKSDSPKLLRSKEKMLSFYRKIDFYLVTSSYEGTPNPALEAAACGVPVITTRVGNMPELIKDGVNGFFVDCNAKSIIRKLNNLNVSSEKYKEMSYRITQKIKKDWTWEKSCILFEKMFREIR